MTEKTKTPKPVFELLHVAVCIRVDGGAEYTGQDLANELLALRLPIHVQYVSPDQVSFTYSFTFPPPKAEQHRLIEHLIHHASMQRVGVTKTITF